MHEKRVRSKAMLAAKYRKRIIQLQIVALLNLLMVTAPGGMFMPQRQSIRNVTVIQPMDRNNHASCHSDTMAKSGMVMADQPNCPEHTCDWNCSLCIHVGSALLSDSVLVAVTHADNYHIDGASILIEVSYAPPPPPPKSLLI